MKQQGGELAKSSIKKTHFGTFILTYTNPWPKGSILMQGGWSTLQTHAGHRKIQGGSDMTRILFCEINDPTSRQITIYHQHHEAHTPYYDVAMYDVAMPWLEPEHHYLRLSGTYSSTPWHQRRMLFPGPWHHK